MKISQAEVTKIDRFIENNQTETLELLKKLCSQPSISTQNVGIKEMVRLLEEVLTSRGFNVDVIPTTGNPVLLAEYTHSNNAEQTLLLYNHYDVQPPDPLDKWDNPPFELAIHDGKAFARGVMDDKGHIVSRLVAIDSIRSVCGDLPCNIKMIIEGEEEIGSPNLPGFVKKHADRLKADACIWEFGDVDFEGAPVQYLGFRGILYVELSVTTARTDAHSGITGTLFPNAAWRLSWALASLKDIEEDILISGFYDDVVPPSRDDLEFLKALPDVGNHYKQTYGVNQLLSGIADGVNLYQAAIFSPGCTICGIKTGYQDPGYKTVLPATASAKIDFRLVPNQTPEDIYIKLREHLNQAGFDDIKIDILGSEKPSRTPVDHPFIALVAEAALEVYEKPQRIFPMSGGSGPAYLFTDVLGMPVVTIGVGYPGSQIHAPNENIRLTDLQNGIRHTARVITKLSNNT